MSDGHFWHDMIEGIVIWHGDDADAPGDSGPATPIEAQPEDLPQHHDAAPTHDAYVADHHLIDAVPLDHPLADSASHDGDAAV